MSQAMSITQLCNSDENNKNQTEKRIPLPAMEPIPSQPHFIRRLPLIDSALKAYENSIVKYGADMIDTYAVGPIYDKLGYSHKSQEDEDTIAATTALARTSLQDTEVTHRHKRIEDTREDRKKQRPSTSPHPYSVQRRPRWQQIVLHAGSAAGTTAAVISEESMKCLKYCLSWLQYAVQHIEQQMTLLRQFLVSLATSQQQQQQKQVTQVASDTTLNNIKKEIVDTLRKVVEVVSRYAGKGLPEQAKLTVRSFILELPSRWAMVNQQALDEVDTPLHVTSIKLLDFSGESIRMLKSVSLVFSDTVERAELWLKRLKAVGGTTGH
ncbi:unnamed protein product [Rhizopus microsporus]|uniref:Opi1-domain-containing protein n=1 Tax=Rhizopus microsporus TaxID=58291 RepID=A0A1X0RUF0_RHIZD|nr:hypothetical protein BCV71DRAFT_228645 [Rhizopus microsporus]